MRAADLLNPLMRELVQMSYDFDQSFVPETTKYESMFGNAKSPLGDAIAPTVDRHRGRNRSFATSTERLSHDNHG